MDWTERAKKSLLPLSQEQDDLQKAIQEWRYTGVCRDYLTPCETCHLCGKKGLRYHFEILDDLTKAQLLVGSSCITRFDIPVYGDDDEQLHGDEKERKLADERRKAQVEQALEPLRTLWKVDEGHRETIADYANKFRKRGRLSPRQLLFLLSRLEQNGIGFHSRLYKIGLRSTQDRLELSGMSDNERSVIWDCLSEKQKESYQKLEAAYRPVTPVPSRPAPVASMPHKYVESAHKYTVVFLDHDGIELKRLFRGSEQFCRGFITREIGHYPEGTEAEIRLTRTQEVVFRYKPGQPLSAR